MSFPIKKLKIKDAHLEHGWIITGKVEDGLWWGRLRNMTVGTPVSVPFDAEYVIEREKTKGDVIGFWHSHPTFPATPSFRDLRTMNTWVDCLGKDILCLIKGTDGLKAYWFDIGEEEPVECQVQQVGNLVFGLTEPLYGQSPLDYLNEEDETNAPISDNISDFKTSLDSEISANMDKQVNFSEAAYQQRLKELGVVIPNWIDK